MLGAWPGAIPGGSVNRAVGTVLGLALSPGGLCGRYLKTLPREELGELSFGSATGDPVFPGSRGPPLGPAFHSCCR